MRNFILVLAGALGTALAVAAAENAKTESDQVARLVARLGHDSFTEREKATKELEGIGPPALGALRQSQNSPDAEVKRRSRELVQKIEKRVEAERVLAPANVRLSYRDVPLTEALTDLATKTGTPFAYRGGRAKLADRRITLDTGDVPFWQALEQFCQKAGLAEAKEQTAGQPALRVQEYALEPAIRFAVPANGPIPPGVLVNPQMPPTGALRNRASAAQDNRPVEFFRPASGSAPAPGAAVVFEDGEPVALPSFFAGAVRIRAADQSLSIAAEPKIPALAVKNLRIDKAVDDRGQRLTPILNDPQTPFELEALAAAQKELMLVERHLALAGNGNGFAAGVSPALRAAIPLRFKAAERPSRLIKELKGVLTVQVQTPPEAMITVDDILKAAGKTTKGTKGGSITVREATQYKNGSVTVRVEVELPPDVNNGDGLALATGRMVVPANANLQLIQQVQMARAQRVIARRAAVNQWIVAGDGVSDSGQVGLTLLDAKGEHFQQTRAQTEMVMNNNVVTSQFVVSFQKKTGQAEPAKLVFSGSRIVTIDVPFALHDIPLP